MEHKEVYEIVDRALAGYARSTSELIASEMSGIKKEIGHLADSTRDLAAEFKSMNGKLRSVTEWRAKHEAESCGLSEKVNELIAGKATTAERFFRVATLIIMVVSVSAAIYFGSLNTKQKQEDKKAEKTNYALLN
jgi:hypothetical protein